MSAIQAVIFDLGGTLIDWPDWDEDIIRRWGLSYNYLTSALPTRSWPTREVYVQAMRAAEREHWQLVVETQASNTPTGLLRSGFEHLGLVASEEELLVALDGYARAVNGWAIVFPDAIQTLEELSRRGYRLGLLSNTWWAAEWHNAELATHGLAPLLDEVVYTSDLPHSKPHPSTFLEVMRRLDVDPTRCVMVGDRLIDDISGSLAVGMRGVWKKTDYPWPRPEHIVPSAIITHLSELLPLFQQWDQ